jgi:hypothetical protein
VIEAAPELGALARQVHQVLGLEWSDSAQGELAELLPGMPDLHAALTDSLLWALTERLGPVERRPLPAAVHDDAVALAREHRFQ